MAGVRGAPVGIPDEAEAVGWDTAAVSRRDVFRSIRSHLILVILAIDTTTRGGSVAVVRDDEQLSLVRGDESRTHGERVPGEIARALSDAALERSAVDLIAVAAGPGAFTGL